MSQEYRSRSPEEWKRHDQEKWQEYERLKGYRRRSIRLTIFNLVIAAMIIVGFTIARNRPVESNVYRFIDGFSISFLSDNTFEYPDPIDFTVKVVNTRNAPAKLSISSFHVQITDESGNVVYTFDYSSNVSKELPEYGSVVIFSLGHEVNLSSLASGGYAITVTFSFNGKPVTLYKEVSYRHVTEVLPAFQYPFYLVGETVLIDLLLRNRSPKTFDVSGGLVTIDVLNEKGETVRSLRFQLGEARVLPTTEELYETGISLVLDKPGLYTFRLQVQGEDYFIENRKTLFVTEEVEDDFSGLSVFAEVPRVAPVGETVPMKFYLTNEKERKRYLELKGVHFEVTQSGVPIFEYKRGMFRLVLLEYEKLPVFDSENWREMKFFQPGNYTVEFGIALTETESLSKTVLLEIR